jgi:hypothetical protein
MQLLPTIFVADPKSIPVHQIITTKEFQTFVETAKGYCLFIEKGNAETQRLFIIETQQHLLTLYSLGRNLPSVKIETDIEFDVTVDDGEMKLLLNSIADRLPFSYYRAVLNPVDKVNLPETGTGDLTDDLGDIYKDLKEALTLYHQKEIGAAENAVFQFKFGYEYHWGEHCIEALYAIHHYLSEHR